LNTIEQDNEVERAKQVARIRDRARVFREVFTSPHGKQVMEAFLVKFGHALPPNVLDNNGRTDEYQTWRRLGHFDVLEFIKTQIEWKEATNDHTSSSGT
jgi:hypothetical protein